MRTLQWLTFTPLRPMLTLASLNVILNRNPCMDQMFLSLHGSCSTTRDDSITSEPLCDDSRGAINRFFRCCSGVLTTGKQVGGIPTSAQIHTSELQRHASCRGSAVQRRGSEVEEESRGAGSWRGETVYVILWSWLASHGIHLMYGKHSQGAFGFSCSDWTIRGGGKMR